MLLAVAVANFVSRGLEMETSLGRCLIAEDRHKILRMKRIGETRASVCLKF